MTKQNGRKSKEDIFYVVTRNGRRAWPKDYWTIAEARMHADSLVSSLKSFGGRNKDSVVIVETSHPENIT
jgi:hypothetical protein